MKSVDINAYINKGDGIEFMKTLPDNSIDLILTDPPYGIYGKISHKFDTKRRNKKRQRVAFYGDNIDVEEFIRQAYRVLNKKHGTFITYTSRDNVCDLFKLTDELFGKYNKRLCAYVHNISSTISSFKAKYDPFVVFEPKGHIRNTKELKEKIGKGYIQDVVFGNNMSNNVKFRGAKPVEILIPYIIYYTEPGMNVLDPFMGTGSTGVASLSLGRNFYGSEIDMTVYEVAKTLLMPYTIEEEAKNE